MRVPRAFLASLVTAALLSACGTTVPLASQGTPQQGSELGGPVSTASGGPAASSDSGGTSASAPVSGTTTTTDVSVEPTSGVSSDQGPDAGSPRSTTPGLAGGTITVGVLAVDYSGIASQFGVKTPDNYFDVYKAIFAKLNKQGGFGGHQINAIYHTANGAATSSQTESEVACAFFTQDNHAQVVFSEIIYLPSFTTCLQKKNVAQIDDGQYGLGKTALAKLPGLISPESVSLEREVAIVFAGMTKAGVLTKKSVVGVLYGGCAEEKAAYPAAVVPLAERYGFKVVPYQLSCYTGVQDLGGSTSATQAAVLQFRSNLVDQVFFMTKSEGFLAAVFTKQASSQDYHPGYLMTSNGYAYANSDQGSQASYPEDALVNMHGMGWGPLYDVGTQYKPSGAVLAARNRCTALDPLQGGAKAAAEPIKSNELQIFYSTCDDLLLFKKVVDANGGAFGLQALRTGFRSAASSFVAAGTFDGSIDLSKHGDGAAEAAPFSFKTACKCFTLDGPPQVIPEI